MEEQCRACLSTESLFNWNKIVAEEVSYSKMFYHITSLNDSDLQHIQFLCGVCGEQIRDIYKFIKKATAADQTLRHAINSKNLDKNRSGDVENDIGCLSIEITLEEEIRRQKDVESLVKEECDANSVQDVDEDGMSERRKASEILFEMVDVDKQDIGFDDSFYTNAQDSNMNELTKSFDCELCGKKFKSGASKKRHLSVHDMKRFLCDACPRTFRDIWGLTKHKKTHDENRPRDFACDHCELKFLTLNALKGHQEIHNDKREKRYQCDQCEKAFFQKGALNVHKRIHTGNLVQCKICHKRYPRLIDLETHMRSHTGEQPFKCTTCGKAFKYCSSLYNHLRMAHFGYVYKCSYCSKQYKDKHSLVEHKKIHKNSAYKCALCDKEMNKKYRLKRHVKGIHNIDNPLEVEQLIISCKAENKYRTMRNFTNIEYKDHIAQPIPGSSSATFKWLKQNQKKAGNHDDVDEGQKTSDDYEEY